MQFNGDTNGLDLYSDCRFLCGLDETSDTTSYPIKAFTRNANMALDKVVGYILKADTTWQFDDLNQTDLPIGTLNLANGQQDYPIDKTELKILRVRVKDSQGNWKILKAIDRRTLMDSQLNETAGDPRMYDVLANSIFLYPKPSYDSSAGLEFQYQRGTSYFTNTDTTKEPGFASPFHRLISLMPALDFCQINGMTARANGIMQILGTPPDLKSREPGSGMIKELMDFYSSRDVDLRPTLAVQREDYGQLGLNPGSGTWPTSPNPRGF